MSVKVETLEKNMVKLEVEVPAEEFEEAIQAAYDGMKSRIDIPGFRKGKAPRKLIEKMYGANFFYEDALDLLLPEAYADAVDEADLDVVSRPSVDLVQVEAGKPLIFTAEVAVRPEVKLGQYKGIEVPKADLEVSEEEVLAEINKEREKDARQISVEDRPVENGDMIMLDFEGFVDGVAFDGGKGENYPLTIGSGAFIPGFEEQLVGKNIGEDVEVQVTFPEDYQAEELAGKAAVFKCKVNEIKVKELPELDDEFAQDVSQFDTLAEYKEDVKAKLAERKAKDAEAAKEDAVLMKIIENAEMEIPEPMLEMQIQQMMDNFKRSLEQQGLSLEQYLQFTGLTSEKMREQVRPNALLSIQSRLVLETIVEEEAIEVTEEEVDAEIREMAEQYKMDEKTLKDLLSGDDLMQLELDLTVKKAVKLVNEAAKEV